MTEAEIEKQADIYANEKVAEIRTGKNSYNTLQMWCDRASGFVDGAKWGLAESRKEIFPSFTKKKEMLETKVSILEEENAQLKADLEEAKKHCKAVDDVNAKLRCCDNCKHVEYDWGDYLRIGKCKTCEKLSNWEMKE